MSAGQSTAYSGLKVVDLSQGIAGPLVGMLFAQHGAEVIKVESPDGGDWARNAIGAEDGNSILSVMGNVGKRSLAVDLKTEPGREILWRLLETADVFIEGFRPGVIKRLGFSYEQVALRCSGIVYLSVSAFGQTGPLSSRAGIDPVIQAFSGMMFENRDAEGVPRVVPSIPVDLGAAFMAFQAVSAALYARRDDAPGRYLDISLINVAAWLNLYSSLMTQINGGASVPSSPTMLCLPTLDEWMFVGVQAHRGWAEFCNAVDRPEAAKDDRFSSPVSRRANAPDVEAFMREALAARSAQYWAEKFTEFGVPHSVVNDCAGFAKEPHVIETGLFSQTRQPGMTTSLSLPTVPGGDRFVAGSPTAVAPLLGADSMAILSEYGYSPQAIEDLLQAGAVAQHNSQESA